MEKVNYKKLIEDFNNGTIDRRIVTLVMNNDGGYWQVDHNNGDEAERIAVGLYDKYGDPNGYGDLVEILIAAGVNAEWC